MREVKKGIENDRNMSSILFLKDIWSCKYWIPNTFEKKLEEWFISQFPNFFKKIWNHTKFYSPGTYRTNSHDLSNLGKRRTIVFVSYLRIGFPSMHCEEKPSPYTSRPDPTEGEKKKRKKGDFWIKKTNFFPLFSLPLKEQSCPYPCANVPSSCHPVINSQPRLTTPGLQRIKQKKTSPTLKIFSPRLHKDSSANRTHILLSQQTACLPESLKLFHQREKYLKYQGAHSHSLLGARRYLCLTHLAEI